MRMRASTLVTLLLAAPLWAAGPIFNLTPPNVTLNIPANTTDQVQKVTVMLENDGTLADFMVQANQSWIEVDTQSGTVDHFQVVPINLTIVPANFDVGTFNCLITISS